MAKRLSEFERTKRYYERLKKLLERINKVERKRREMLEKAYARRGRYRDVRDRAIRTGRPHKYADHVIEVQNRRIQYYSSGISQVRADRQEVLQEIKKVEKEIPKEKWREIRKFAFTFDYRNKSSKRVIDVVVLIDAPEGSAVNYYKAGVLRDMASYFISEFYNPIFEGASDVSPGNLGQVEHRYPSEDNDVRMQVQYNDLKYPSNNRESEWFTVEDFDDARHKAEEIGREWE
jgi:hypothetical protein